MDAQDENAKATNAPTAKQSNNFFILFNIKVGSTIN
jgi:hypothetical protein